MSFEATKLSRFDPLGPPSPAVLDLFSGVALQQMTNPTFPSLSIRGLVVESDYSSDVLVGQEALVDVATLAIIVNDPVIFGKFKLSLECLLNSGGGTGNQR